MTVTIGHTAFVAGATGYVGRAVVAELRRRGIATVAHVRPDSARLREWRDRFESLGATVDDTPWDEAAMAATIERVRPTLVFALLGTTRKRMQRADGRDSYESVDYGLSALLLRAMQRGAPAARFIYLSSAGTGPSARGQYLRVRWRLEEELRASDVPWTIARPAFITGTDREETRPLERVGAVVIDAALHVIGALGARRLRSRYASITGSALAAGLVDHAIDPRSDGRSLGSDELRGHSSG